MASGLWLVMLPIIKYRYIFLAASGFLILASAAALLLFGLRFGIDFTGGSLLEVQFGERLPASEEVRQKLTELGLGDIVIQSTEGQGMIFRFRHVDEETHQKVLGKLKELSPLEEQRFDAIGPVIGEELKRKSAVAVAAATLAIMVYIAWAFRRVSRPVASWQYGFIVAAVAFFHDVLLPLGVFAALGKFAGVEVGISFVAALLTVLGFSVHDTIVVFDRTRENLSKSPPGTPFSDVVNKSVNQTLGRSITTSLTILITTAAIYLFGGKVLETFSIVLLIGVATGTYSSIFVASPLLIEFQRLKLPRIRRVRR